MLPQDDVDVIETLPRLDIAEVSQRPATSQTFQFQFSASRLSRGKHSVRVFRCSPGYFHQASRETYDVVFVDPMYALVYQTGFMDVGQELLLQVEQDSPDGLVVDMYKVSCPVAPDPQLAALVEQYRKGDEFVLEGLVADNFNEGRPCQVTVGDDEVLVEGRADFTRAFRCVDVQVVDPAGCIQLRHNDWVLEFPWAKNDPQALRALSVLL